MALTTCCKDHIFTISKEKSITIPTYRLVYSLLSKLLDIHTTSIKHLFYSSNHIGIQLFLKAEVFLLEACRAMWVGSYNLWYSLLSSDILQGSTRDRHPTFYFWSTSSLDLRERFVNIHINAIPFSIAEINIFIKLSLQIVSPYTNTIVMISDAFAALIRDCSG